MRGGTKMGASAECKAADDEEDDEDDDEEDDEEEEEEENDGICFDASPKTPAFIASVSSSSFRKLRSPASKEGVVRSGA